MAADGDLTPDLAAALGGAANTRVMTLDVAPGGVRGAVAVARHLGDRPFDAGHDDIMAVLADLVGAAWRAALTAKGDPRRRDAVIEALAVLAGLRRSGVPTADPEAVRVLAQLGRRLGLAEPDIHRLRTAGVLHDAGMAMLDPDVVLKPADLDEDEREHVGRHLERGVEMLTALSDDPELVDMVRLHHERVDGRGHPEGRQGDDIPLGARIIAVVDAWYAMIRPRPWRAGMPAAAAMAEISRHAGTQFDADDVDALGEIITTDSPAAEPVTAGPADPERR
jgi:response regulator RpfG family c-di-GMP phosphodiesterase